MRHIIAKHKFYWSQKQFIISVLIGVLFFTASIIINYYAIIYAALKSSNAVTDILLNILPVIDTNIIFVEGSLVFIIFVIYLLTREPKVIPFVLKSAALFIVIRSFFIILTHFGPFPERAAMDSFISVFTTPTDLFFSGHTGMPFLFALIFWRQKILRYVFLSSSIVAGISVLLAHYHYSIDVASAYFITFGIFHIAQRLFKKDYDLFLLDEAKY